MKCQVSLSGTAVVFGCWERRDGCGVVAFQESSGVRCTSFLWSTFQNCSGDCLALSGAAVSRVYRLSYFAQVVSFLIVWLKGCKKPALASPCCFSWWAFSGALYPAGSAQGKAADTVRVGSFLQVSGCRGPDSKHLSYSGMCPT